MWFLCEAWIYFFVQSVVKLVKWGGTEVKEGEWKGVVLKFGNGTEMQRKCIEKKKEWRGRIVKDEMEIGI